MRRIVLFGSRVRGDFDDSSDMDVLVVLEDCAPAVMERARSARYQVMERRGFQPLISLLLLSEKEWQELAKHSAGLKHNIQTEGRTIWPTI
jgi:predicted nucleotidyltransferase